MKAYREKFNHMHYVGKYVTDCLVGIGRDIIRPGYSTKDIEDYVFSYQSVNKLNNSQIGYHDFPGYCCTSVNNEICHGIPSRDKILNEGDLVKVDITFNKDGYHADACYTFVVGETSEQNKKLISVGKQAILKALEVVSPGVPISFIGRMIENYVRLNGFYVVEEYAGHSIGTEMHMKPVIPNYYMPEYDFKKMKAGDAFTIEPMVTIGTPWSMILEDNWTVVTADKSMSAQFEVTVGITEDGYEIFTPINLENK